MATFSAQLCVFMCVRIHLGSASLRNATQSGSGSSSGVMVEVVLMDGCSTDSVQRYDLMLVNIGHETDEAQRGRLFIESVVWKLILHSR